MKIFMATLATETNTFSPLPTGWAGFTGGREWYRHDASRQPPTIANIPLIAWRRLGEADGHTVTESICTFAQPAGTTLQPVYEGLRDMLLDDLRAAMPIDIVLLFMHGAMVAFGYDDCEGDTLTRIRAIVGASATIGLELDLHCHLTETMRTTADAIILYKEYPHVDIGDRAPELYRICRDAAEGKIRPVMAYYDCRMIGTYRPTQQPVRGFVDRMKALEGHNGILSISFGHGFPWADVADVGSKILVIADADEPAAPPWRNTWARNSGRCATKPTPNSTASTKASTPRRPAAATARSSSPTPPTMPAAAPPPTAPSSCAGCSNAA